MGSESESPAASDSRAKTSMLCSGRYGFVDLAHRVESRTGLCGVGEMWVPREPAFEENVIMANWLRYPLLVEGISMALMFQVKYTGSPTLVVGNATTASKELFVASNSHG